MGALPVVRGIFTVFQSGFTTSDAHARVLPISASTGGCMRPLALTLALAAVSTASSGQPDRSELAAVALADLRLMYLHCDRRAAQTLLGAAEAGHCSLVAEELKQRGFGGDFDRLLAWWRAQRRVDAQPSAAGAREPEPFH
jgi:hypothetical protein